MIQELVCCCQLQQATIPKRCPPVEICRSNKVTFKDENLRTKESA